MFFSEQLLTDRGPLAQVWLAANLEKKLKRSDLLNTDIPKSVKAIVDSEKKVPMALRLSGQLLLGVVRIYGRQTGYLLDDCSHTVTRIKMTFKPGNVDLPTSAHGGSKQNTTKASAALTLGNAISDLDLALPPAPVIPGLNLPGLPNLALDDLMPTNRNLVSNIDDITLPQHDMSIEIGRNDEEDELANLGDDLELDLGLDLDGELNFDVGDTDAANQSIEIPRGDDDELANLDDGLDLDLDLGDNLEAQLAAQQASEQLDLPMSPIEPLDEEGDLTLEEPTINMAEALAGNVAEPAPAPQRKRRAARGKRAKFDDETQLDQDFVQQQRRNRSRITYYHPQLTAVSVEFNVFNDVSQELMQLVDPDTIRKTLTERHSRDDQEQVITPAASPNGKRSYEEVEQEESQNNAMDIELPDMVMENTETVAETAAAKAEADAEIEEDILVTGTVDGIAKSTVATAQNLRQHLIEDKADKVQFSTLVEGKGRKATVQNFFELLVLATKDTISINQPTPYSDFSVSAKENLYDDMWSEIVV